MRKRDIFAIIGALLVAIGLSICILLGQALTAGAWGLSFQTEGTPPIGPASAAQLAEFDASYRKETTEKVLFLTFDAGYEHGYTGKILDILKKHKVPATFFLVGHYIDKNPDLVRRMVDEGHTVGNHTLHHPDMRTLSEEEIRQELEGLEQRYFDLIGQEMPKYYRPPRGIFDDKSLQTAQKCGYKTVFWSLAYADWNNDAQPTKEQAFSKLLPRVHPGAVVLLHSTSATNAEILDELLTKWKAMGYTFAPLDALFES